MKPEDAHPAKYEAACAGKERYPSDGAALGVLRLARKSGRRKAIKLIGDFDALEVYRCPFEEIHPELPWHIGHKRYNSQ